jgi:hypothetical protein
VRAPGSLQPHSPTVPPRGEAVAPARMEASDSA